MEQWKFKIQVMDESNAEEPKKCGSSSLWSVKWCSYNKLHENAKATTRAQVDDEIAT